MYGAFHIDITNDYVPNINLLQNTPNLSMHNK